MEDDSSKYHIGDVHVTDAECENPYRYNGQWRIGESRRVALLAFCNGEDTAGMQLWHVPANGGARKITANDVAWSSSGLKR